LHLISFWTTVFMYNGQNMGDSPQIFYFSMAYYPCVHICIIHLYAACWCTYFMVARYWISLSLPLSVWIKDLQQVYVIRALLNNLVATRLNWIGIGIGLFLLS
jgi:hypothetical protein